MGVWGFGLCVFSFGFLVGFAILAWHGYSLNGWTNIVFYCGLISLGGFIGLAVMPITRLSVNFTEVIQNTGPIITFERYLPFRDIKAVTFVISPTVMACWD